MADYVDITETYLIAGDFDSRKRFIRTRTGGANPLAVCSGVTWSIGAGGSLDGTPTRTWYWQVGSRGSIHFTKGGLVASPPTPQVVTNCTI